jgi:hypothetical protein
MANGNSEESSQSGSQEGGDLDPRVAAAPFHSAIDHLRETAKWIVGIFGGIGGVLIGSSSLSDVGQLDVGNPRLIVAAVSGIFALVTIGLIVGFALSVLVSPPRTLNSLVDDEALENPPEAVQWAKAQSSELNGLSIASLRDTWENETEQVRKYELANIIFELLAAVRYYETWQRFNKAKWVAFICGALAALAIVIFVYSANPAPTTPRAT